MLVAMVLIKAHYVTCVFQYDRPTVAYLQMHQKTFLTNTDFNKHLLTYL